MQGKFFNSFTDLCESFSTITNAPVDGEDYCSFCLVEKHNIGFDEALEYCAALSLNRGGISYEIPKVKTEKQARIILSRGIVAENTRKE